MISEELEEWVTNRNVESDKALYHRETRTYPQKRKEQGFRNFVIYLYFSASCQRFNLFSLKNEFFFFSNVCGFEFVNEDQ